MPTDRAARAPLVVAACAAAWLLAWGAACGGGSRTATNSVSGVPPGTLAGISPRYQASFGALRAAVVAHDDATARRVLDNLMRRLQLDTESLAGADEDHDQARALPAEDRRGGHPRGVSETG